MSFWATVVASNLLVASLIALLALSVGRGGRHARLAHGLWVAFFLKLITPPIVVLPYSLPAEWVPETTAAFNRSLTQFSLTLGEATNSVERVASSSRRVAGSTVGARSIGLDAFRVNWASLLLVVWMAGFATIACRSLVRVLRFRRLVIREGKPDAEATAKVAEMLRATSTLGIRRAVPRVVRVPLRVSPMLVGLGRRPMIICPDQLWQGLTSAQRESFLAHETAHYSRRDHWVRLLECVVTAAYWWCPLVFYARRQLERHEEVCCDAWAVRRLGTPPRRYADALLRVVDFVSEHQAGLPRLASGMQPSDSMEERLRLLMRPASVDTDAGPMSWLAGSCCCVLWLVHPAALPQSQPWIASNLPALAPSTSLSGPRFDSADVTAESRADSDRSRSELPQRPVGFWNRTPKRRWADFSLTLPGARLVAETSRGISIQVPDRPTLRFTNDQLTAIVEIPRTRRVVIGDRGGHLRLWDLSAGMPVSLIGRHRGSVTSLAYHQRCGLVSGDDTGALMRWDVQSGQPQAGWSGPDEVDDALPIQSVRSDRLGETLAVVVGCWSDEQNRQELCLLDAVTLETNESRPLRSPSGESIAVVYPTDAGDWIAVDWSGQRFNVNTGERAGTVAKPTVSAIALAESVTEVPVDEDSLK